MPLLTSLMMTADTLGYLQKQFDVTQNNVANASTPGYAKQRLTSEPLPFSPELGLPGGVRSGGLVSSRDEFSDAAVRRQQTLYSGYAQQQTVLEGVEPIFNVGTDSGIPAALTKLFQSFSAWSINPNSALDRSSVITQAGEVALRFNEAASALSQAGAALDPRISAGTAAINKLASQVRELNVRLSENFQSRSDPNLDAQLHTTLEELSSYVQVTAVRQEDGTVTVLAGGQVPLVVGDRTFDLRADLAGGAPVIRDSTGGDITPYMNSGRIGALIELRGSTIPSYQAGLNQLAGSLAGRINGILAAGVDSGGNAGQPLLGCVAGSEAATLKATGITAPELAGALPAAPGGNGNILVLAGLASSGEINGLTFVEHYGQLAAGLGYAVSAASENASAQQDLLTQAQSVRQDLSGVSLDEEAIRLMEFQRAYQANARIVQILDQLTEETVNMLK
jgi:flagellar hook-associated protein 1